MREASEITTRIFEAFPAPASPPRMTLRAGDALDIYDSPPPPDPQIDEPSAAYLERYADGLAHLDAPRPKE